MLSDGDVARDELGESLQRVEARHLLCDERLERADLVLDGACSFTDLSKLSIRRFADLPADWREQAGWRPTSHAEGSAALGL